MFCSLTESMRHARRLMLAALIGLASPLGAFAAQTVRTVEPVSPCFVTPPKDAAVNFKYDCGYVIVPENWSAPRGRLVKLGFLRFKARTATPNAPVFMLAGRPGQTLIVPDAFSLFAPTFLGPILDSRDVVIIDQRGTKHAVPQLDCPDFHSLAWTAYSRKLSEGQAIALERETLERCVREARARGVDLAQYNSVAIAADVNAARAALAVEIAARGNV